jgi:hypothetical protein
MANGVEPAAERLRRVGVERVVLALDRPAAAGERPARVALRHEPLDAHRPAGSQQVVGARGAQAVGLREVAVEMADVERLRQRGELVDDHVGIGLRDHVGHGIGVEGVGHGGSPAQLADEVGLRPGHAHHVVAGGEQLRH